jgi:arsenate reductase (thioredoxin)
MSDKSLGSAERTHDKPAIVFLCVQNAGRSQMAAGFAKHIGGDDVDIYSGGSDPADAINPVVVEAMREKGIDIAGEVPKAWTDEVIRAADVIVTMGCGDSCPVLPGKRYLDWEVADPAGLPIEAVRPIRDDIGKRVRELVTELKVSVHG